ncbi:MAG: MarR family winged helix-turn-helix transcriptional regulator [Candidatus Hermodarchaeota archaeon]
MKKKKIEDSESLTLSDSFELIYKINKKIRDWQRKIIKEFRVTIPQYCVIKQLGTHGGLAFKDIAEKCNLSRSTMTGVIDTMEIKKNLVSREANPEDRRSLLVVLTEKGKKLFDSLPLHKTIFKNIGAGLKPEEIEQLNDLLNKLLDNIY